MTEWFHERYMSRSEHQEIVAYYRKLVAQLHVKVRELRDQMDMRHAGVMSGKPDQPTGPPPTRSSPVDWSGYGGNIVSLDLHRRAKGPGGA